MQSNNLNNSIATSHSVYQYAKVNAQVLQGTVELAIVIDLNKEGSVSVTNNIENVAEEVNAKRIIYYDTLAHWDYWDTKKGFISLARNGEPSIMLKDALEEYADKYEKGLL